MYVSDSLVRAVSVTAGPVRTAYYEDRVGWRAMRGPPRRSCIVIGLQNIQLLENV